MPGEPVDDTEGLPHGLLGNIDDLKIQTVPMMIRIVVLTGRLGHLDPKHKEVEHNIWKSYLAVRRILTYSIYHPCECPWGMLPSLPG